MTCREPTWGYQPDTTRRSLPVSKDTLGGSGVTRQQSGQDLGLLAFEFGGRDDAPVAQVGQLAQLVRRAPP